MKPRIPFSYIWILIACCLLINGCLYFYPHGDDPSHQYPNRWEAIQGEALLQAGPMVGYIDVREAMLWVQTHQPALVHIRYHEQRNPEEVFESFPLATHDVEGCTAHILLVDLEPDTAYDYEVLINGVAAPRPYATTFRTRRFRPYDRYEAGNFSVALGSCAYINDFSLISRENPYGGDYSILESIHAKHPDLMIWLGDNHYFTSADWNTRTGMLRRYSHGRAIPELQPLLGSVPQYAIWDDHDFGPNNSDRSNVMRDAALDVFQLFWANPSYGVAGQPGVTTSFSWEDVQFFLLDNRYFRTPNNRKTGERTQLGKHQVQWLIDALVSSRATFKVVAMGGQFVTELKRHETYANVHPEERREILELLAAEKIEGLIFLSGDRHYSEVSRVDRKGHYPLYDFTVSPLTAGAYTEAEKNEVNQQRVEESLVNVRNFALMNFSGSRDDRQCALEYFDTLGKPLYSMILPAKALKYGK
jgi:alkaline phosphatase D